MELVLDRVGGLRPAGIPSKNTNNSNNSEGVTACLTHVLEDVTPLEAKVGVLDYKLPPPTTNIYQGFNTGVKKCLQPDTGLSFVDQLQGEFRDTVYSGYWTRPVGRSPDPSPMLPEGMDPGTTLYGRPTPQDISAAELVNPRKSYMQVVEESRMGHGMYKRTHHDYDPGEQTERGYGAPYRRGLVWGAPTPCDPQGGCMRKVMTADADDSKFVSKILADHRTRTRSLVGKVLAPNNNLGCVPQGHAFGRVNHRAALGAGELLRESPPSLDKVDLLEELSHVNTLRQQLSKKHPSPLRDVLDGFHLADVRNTGSLPMDEAYKVLARHRIFPDHALLEGMLRRLGILDEDGVVTYEKLADVLNVNAEFPDIEKIQDVPKEIMSFVTTNQIAQRYHCSDEYGDTKDTPRAGVPPQPYVAIDGVISPNIFTNYGLSPKDFFVSRTPEFLRTLFQRIGYHLDETDFCEVYDLAKDEKGCVSVQTFYCALKRYK